MRRRKLLSLIDVKQIENAIQLAEKQTTGEIRVSVARFFWGDVHAAAERAFSRLGMQKTEHRNGVLIFVVPSRRKFTVLGDAGIHAKVGQEFWDTISNAMSKEFRASRFTDGLIHGIAEAGKQLAAHFPADPTQERNELPNEVDI